MSKRVGSAKERSVFVGNIPYDVTEDQLKEIFSGAGTVVNFRLVTDRETGKPKGYGFCEYADGATALSAMRNLNGYEVNGRNLRVDFADGGDKSSSNGGGGGGGSSGGGHYHDNKHTASVSGEAIIKAIEGAISRFGPLKLYDMLVELKEHARQRPDHTKAMLSANPALTHALIQSFKTLNIPLPTTPEMPPALVTGLPPPPPHLHAMPPYSRAMVPPPQRSPLTASGPPGGGILGMAPPMGPPQPPHGAMGQHAPPAMGGVGSVPPPKAGGTRWSSRPGPLAGMMAPPGGPPPPVMQQQPPPQQPQHTGPPAYQGPPPPQRMAMPPPQQQQPQQIAAPPIQQQQPPPSLQQQVNRDPRRARDPRLAKRPRPDEPPVYQGLTQQQQQQQANGTFDAIAELARDMTPQKLNLLPPNERQMLMMYMQQHGMAFGG